MSSDVVLGLTGVTKEYAGTPPVMALRGVDLRVWGVKGIKAKGKQMTSKIIARIDTKTGRWWDKKLRSPKGILT